MAPPKGIGFKQEPHHVAGFFVCKEDDGYRGSAKGAGRYKKAYTNCRVVFCRFGKDEEISIYSFMVLTV